MRVTNATGYDEPRDSISHDWLKTFRAWGMTPVLLPNIGAEAVDYMRAQNPDILLLTGGEDIGVSPSRDETETPLLGFALDIGFPVFGVCRGLQLLNDRLGGRLSKVEGHVAKPHAVTVSPEWAEFYPHEVQVNSYHNIGIQSADLARDLAVTATDAAGHVEAVRHRRKPIAAVMWHPERPGGLDGDRRVIEALARGS